jgi:elongation factor G
VKQYQPSHLRNVALVSHSSAGKTSIAEALLYLTGVTNRRGRVEDRNTVSDFDPEEQRRGISINVSVVPIEWRDHKINLLDAPGYLDFAGDAKSALHVADAAVIVADAVAGAEVGTELMWEFCEERALPRLLLLNKMDRDTARFERSLTSLRNAFGPKVVPIHLPIGQGAEFRGVVNLITRKAYDKQGKETTVPADMQGAVEDAALGLMESAAEGDDDLIMKYLDGEELSAEEVAVGLRVQVQRGNIIPVLVGSASEGIGMSALLDALLELCPSPTEAPAREATTPDDKTVELKCAATPPLAAFVFKTVVDPYGTLALIRVFNGTLKSDSRVVNRRTGQEERIGQLVTLRGKEQIPTDHLEPGDIGAIAKLAHTQTGDTLGDVSVASCVMPGAVYAVAVHAANQSDVDKLVQTLNRIILEDPSLRWERRMDTRQMVMVGLGDNHLDVAKHRLEKLGVKVEMEMPKVAYKETITDKQTARYRHKKQTGGAGQFGEVELRVEPQPRGEAFSMGWEVFGGAVSRGYEPSIEKGIKSVLEHGVIAGYPVVDVKAIVTDGKEHPVDSKDIAFQTAGREAFKEAFLKAKPVLLEPVYNVEITVPDSYLGDIMGDLNTRRGRVMGMEQVGHKSVVQAQVPESSMLRYAVELRSMTQGHGLFSMKFSHYDPVPDYLAKDVIAAHKAEADEQH